jgi:hypothetical protein
MPRLLCAVTAFCLASMLTLADCPCRHIAKGETTHWGGNELIVQYEEKPYKELRGVILDHNDDPATGALVEVWTNPDYLLRGGPQTPEEQSKQQRVKACRTGTDGRFCIHTKPGKYEVRVSLGSGWDVTKAYVFVDREKGQKTNLTIRMHLGT